MKKNLWKKIFTKKIYEKKFLRRKFLWKKIYKKIFYEENFYEKEIFLWKKNSPKIIFPTEKAARIGETALLQRAFALGAAETLRVPHLTARRRRDGHDKGIQNHRTTAVAFIKRIIHGRNMVTVVVIANVIMIVEVYSGVVLHFCSSRSSPLAATARSGRKIIRRLMRLDIMVSVTDRHWIMARKKIS